MSVRDVFFALATGSGDPSSADYTHVECRDCGTNLPGGTEQCPNCGGEIAVYELP
jgi:hypothetical protein